MTSDKLNGETRALTKEINAYVLELRDSSLSAASAGFCGMVLRESLTIPDINDSAEFHCDLNQVLKMHAGSDAETFSPADLVPMAVILKLAI